MDHSPFGKAYTKIILRVSQLNNVNNSKASRDNSNSLKKNGVNSNPVAVIART